MSLHFSFMCVVELLSHAGRLSGEASDVTGFGDGECDVISADSVFDKFKCCNIASRSLRSLFSCCSRNWIVRD